MISWKAGGFLEGGFCAKVYNVMVYNSKIIHPCPSLHIQNDKSNSPHNPFILQFRLDCMYVCLQSQQPAAVNHIGKPSGQKDKDTKEREKEREKERNAAMAMKMQLAQGGHQ